MQILSDVMSALITSQIKENNFIDAESVQWCESSVHLVCFILVCTSVHSVCTSFPGQSGVSGHGGGEANSQTAPPFKV